MYGENPMSLTRHDHRNPSTPTPYFFRSHEAYDQQEVAASNALSSLNQPRAPVYLDPEITNSQNDFRFFNSLTPSSYSMQERTAWVDGHTCTALSAPDPAGLWEPVAHGHMVNPPSQYDGQEYNETALSSFTTADGLPFLAPLQQYTPSSEPSTMPLSSPSTPLPSIGASSRSFNSTPASSVEPEHGEMDHLIPMTEQMNQSAESISSAPYSKLIERALLEAEGNRLLLKDIYTWIEINTSKASNPSSNGWKNSVRHNLSMNGAFTKIAVQSSENKSQKVYMWMLEPSAKEFGIESTTRFRRKNDAKRRTRNFPLNDRRAQSGRRGGWASHKSTQLQKDSRLASKLQPSQHPEYESSSASGYPDFEPPQTAVPGYVQPVLPVYYQSYLPPPPPQQQYSTQMAKSESYDGSSDYVGPEPTAQLPSFQNTGIQ